MSENVERYEVVVLGAGAAGLAAAIFAALEGRRVVMIERTEYVGGTSAFSAATAWVPNTRLAATINAQDDLDRARCFLDAAVGNRSSKAMRETFLREGPAAIHLLMDRTCVQFRARAFHPDYLSELPGATVAGRALEPVPYDAAELGEDLKLIRPPIPEFTILGGLMPSKDDISHLLKVGRSAESTLYAVRLLGRYFIDRVRFGTSTRLVMGQALVARLLKAARDLDVDIWTNAKVTKILPGDEISVTVERDGSTRQILASGGVILASGGFARHPELRAKMLPHPVPIHSPSAPGHTGELHDIALQLGAQYGGEGAQSVFLAPVSLRRRRDGSLAVFPHFILDRSKPGIIAVGRNGRRFTNESRSYHEFAAAQFETKTVPAYLIADAMAVKKYGLGIVRPGALGLKSALLDGYVIKGETVRELAARLGISAVGLEETIERMSKFARTGHDIDFGRGRTEYECANGDGTNRPNPTLGALSTPPYYAVQLWPSDIGSATGLVTDVEARVLDMQNHPIPGLYACGNDMESIMGGVYPGPGITIGPAITFALIAARSSSARAAGVHKVE
ncbi:MAG: FAD-dependent oxidoreductase [Rhizobiaceae bacterium]|nr:FAD-dependent oxidoreductase [Rhizobiaceae bacterium]